MRTRVKTKILNTKLNKHSELEMKAAFFDEIIKMMEDKTLGYMMSVTEKEKNISAKEADELLCL